MQRQCKHLYVVVCTNAHNAINHTPPFLFSRHYVEVTEANLLRANCQRNFSLQLDMTLDPLPLTVHSAMDMDPLGLEQSVQMHGYSSWVGDPVSGVFDLYEFSESN